MFGPCFVIISLRTTEQITLLYLWSSCHVAGSVLCIFLSVSCVGLWFAIMEYLVILSSYCYMILYIGYTMYT